MEIEHVRVLASQLMAEHGLCSDAAGIATVEAGRELGNGALDIHRSRDVANWRLGFDHARKRAGMTDFSAQKITLSAPLMRLYSENMVRQVVLHEIAHALVGAGHHHDASWKRVAAAIGAEPRASLVGTPQVPPLWQGRCNGGHEFGRYRRPQTAASCMACARKEAARTGAPLRREYDERYRITWTNCKTGEVL
ncbi:MAG: SprT-like domain-containing protein [Arcanobacterium sp.]|nr:SprT-like domain-containing protein [Arcanobacterium sp.]